MSHAGIMWDGTTSITMSPKPPKENCNFAQEPPGLYIPFGIHPLKMRAPGNQQEVMAICTDGQCPGISLGPRWGQGEVSCQQFLQMKGPSCYFYLCCLFKIHPETATKKGRGLTFPFPSTSKNCILYRKALFFSPQIL